MKQRLRPVSVALLLIVVMVAFVPGWHTAAFQLATSYSGTASIDGPHQLDLSVSPAVSMPGQTLTLDLRLTNQTAEITSPEVVLQLPDGLSLDPTGLPPGMTVNLQNNDLNWMPVLAANGGSQRTGLQLRVERADISQPEKLVTAVLTVGETQQQAAADVWIGIPPQVSDILNPPQVAVGQPFHLRADVEGSGPASMVWDLGDGRLVEVNEPEIVFPAPGIYEVSLEAANPLTAVSATQSITIVPHPAAQFSMDDNTPAVDQPVHFISQSGGLPPLTYAWDFGDGTISSEPEPTHQYAVDGTYQVSLVVSNQFGQSQAFWPVTVGRPPVADMIMPDSVPSGETIEGQAFGDDSVTAFTWDMGDGHIYEGERVSHIYGRGGDVYVSMAASNDFGSTQIGQWIYVDQGTTLSYLPAVLRGQGLESALVADPLLDPLGILLDPVHLDEPFVMGPMEVPDGSSQSDQLFLYINEARRQFDLPPLNHVYELSAAAQHHTEDMAAFQFTAHAGSDGSYPAERLLTYRYPRGYAGEATAWGFQYPYQAVEFWVNSPAHRRIILNRYATDVGVGYTLDYSAPNVWYWTAEFGNVTAAATPLQMRLNLPLADVMPEEQLTVEELEAAFPMITAPLSYSWNWPLPLEKGQRFVLYLVVNGEAKPIGFVEQPTLGSRYSLEAAAYPEALDIQSQLGQFQWQVRLEDEAGFVYAQSQRRSLFLSPDPELVPPTPEVTPTPSPVPTATPEPTATPMPVAPSPTPRRGLPPPIIITATPSS